MFPFDQHATWGRLASRLYETVVSARAESLHELLLTQVKEPIRGKVLEVGAGAGHTAVLLARRHPGAQVLGVDSSPDMVRMAQRRARSERLANLEFQEGNALALPFPEGCFDGALSVASLKHWPSPAQGLRELHRTLKPGGWMLVVETDRAAPRETVERFARHWPWIPPALFTQGFRRFVTASSLRLEDAERLLRQVPFSHRRVEAWPDMPFWIMRALKS